MVRPTVSALHRNMAAWPAPRAPTGSNRLILTPHLPLASQNLALQTLLAQLCGAGDCPRSVALRWEALLPQALVSGTHALSASAPRINR